MTQRVGLRHIAIYMRKPAIPYEDLSTYVEVDPDSKLVVDGQKVTYTQVNAFNLDWLRTPKTFTADYTIQFEVTCTGHRGNVLYNGDWYCLAVMNNATPYSSTYCGGAILNEQLGVGPKLGIYQGSESGQYPQVRQAINQDQTYYCTLERISGTLKLYIYTDSARTTLLATLTSPTVLTTAGTQLFACSLGLGEESGWVSGYTERILVI